MRSEFDPLSGSTSLSLRCFVYLALFALFFLLTSSVYAQDLCRDPVGRLASIEGEVEVRSEGGGWGTAQLDHRLCEGDTIRVGDRSRVAIQLINNVVLRVDQNTSIRLVNIKGEAEQRSWIDLVSGALQSFSRKPQLLKITTPHLNGDINGTEFYVQAEDKRSLLR